VENSNARATTAIANFQIGLITWHLWHGIADEPVFTDGGASVQSLRRNTAHGRRFWCALAGCQPDEFGELAEGFNQMQTIADLYATLEQRVEENPVALRLKP